MAIEVTVPELGESVLEATVARWLKKEGDPVSVGEVLVELETDKVNLEVGAKGAGVLQKIEAPEGADVKVGDVLGRIEEKASAPQAVQAKAEEQETEAAPAAAQQAAQAREQDLQLEGLRQVIVGAVVHPQTNVQSLALGREKYERDGGGLLVFAKSLNDGVAVQLRHHHVAEDEVAARPLRHASQMHDVADRRNGRERLQDLLRLARRGDEAQMDHVSAPLA